MKTGRLEAFSDGVIAIIITIMVLELKVPHPMNSDSLRSITPELLCYVLSFIVIAIMWVNHHHLIHQARDASARVLWANNHLLFWMSLIPFVTGCIGENPQLPRCCCVRLGAWARGCQLHSFATFYCLPNKRIAQPPAASEGSNQKCPVERSLFCSAQRLPSYR